MMRERIRKLREWRSSMTEVSSIRPHAARRVKAELIFQAELAAHGGLNDLDAIGVDAEVPEALSRQIADAIPFGRLEEILDERFL
jgi:hypothetical protein